VATTVVEQDIDGGPPRGCCQDFRQRSPSKLMKTLMAGPPWEVMSGALAAATTEVDEDVDDKPPGRCCREFRQRPPPKLLKTLMAGPLGGA
jgi:hypothetical protein